MLIFPIIAILCAPALWVVLGRPRFLPLLGQPDPKTISIIIPARNEESNIKNLLSSINEQSTSAHEVIVVDDGSTDLTAEISQKLGATVLEAKPLPKNWKGKPWACQQGADLATGEWLLFLDADTRLEPTTIAQLGHLTSKDNHVFSICPWHRVKKPYEELSVFFNVLMVVGMNAFGASKNSKDDTRLVGQTMLISRSIYKQCGGHSAVKDEILENYHLSAVLKSMGVKRSCYLGQNTLTMRMFPEGFNELWQSWKKGFVSGASEVPTQIIVWTSVWITGMFIAFISLGFAITADHSPLMLEFSIAAYSIHVLGCLFAFRTVGSFSFFNALFYPITLIFYHILFITALVDAKRGKQTQWKGRNVS